VLSIIATLFALSFRANWLFFISQVLLAVFLAFCLIDIYLLFSKRFTINATRKTSKVFSLGDKNVVELFVENTNNLRISILLIDELPFQFQERDFKIEGFLDAFEKKVFKYSITPLHRGMYQYGNLNTFVNSAIGLIRRRDIHSAKLSVAVYPSTILMKKFELKALDSISTHSGVRKMRRIGHSYEFDHIHHYNQGDDPRSINWKASGRRADLMVNHYLDEKSQQIYCILDKSRSMRLPFNGLTLLDYSINTSLVISNIALLKHDNAGLISFSDKLGSIIKSGSGNNQLRKIYNALYNEKENPLDADYELLYNILQNIVRGYSLLFLFTNFESIYALERVLPILRKINRLHLLVVVFFENSEVTEMANKNSESVEDIYNQTIARRLVGEKELIINELRKHKIQVIYTKPDLLPVNTINKYLELKSRGLI
jgi:uncharacterized protein (DUF58 family)